MVRNQRSIYDSDDGCSSKRRRRLLLAWKCLLYWLVVWSFPGFACPGVPYIPCTFSALAARLIFVRAVLSLFPVSCSLHSFPFFPRLQPFQFLPSAVGNCVSFVTSFCFCFCFCFLFCCFFLFLFLVTIIYFFLNLLPCPADHEPDWQPRAVFFLFSVCEYGWGPIG